MYIMIHADTRTRARTYARIYARACTDTHIVCVRAPSNLFIELGLVAPLLGFLFGPLLLFLLLEVISV
jgi:hypothetical protein